MALVAYFSDTVVLLVEGTVAENMERVFLVVDCNEIESGLLNLLYV